MDNYPSSYFTHFSRREAHFSCRNRNRLGAILAYRNGGTLLEIGCAVGGFLEVANRHFTVEGMDISPYAVEQARMLLPQVTVRQGDIQSAALPGEAYDAVCLYNVLEHLPDPLAAVEKVFAALKPGGIIAGSVPNNFALIGGANTVLSNLIDRTHISTYPPTRWREIFEQAGFARIDFFGELLLGHNRSWHVTRIGWEYLSFNLMFICEKEG